jgi:prolipoprotein diacylglyceryltransferase
VGRIVFEFMRSDEANEILGLRVNVWTSVLVFLLGVTLFWLFGRRAALRERVPEKSHHPG